MGHHDLACRSSAGRHTRHNLMNDIILRASQSAGVPAICEPPGLSRTDAKRPDGATLIPWSRGRCLLWDATTPDTLAPSHFQGSANQAGTAALTAEVAKRHKYAPLLAAHDFVPVAIETLGVWGPQAADLVSSLGKIIANVTGELRSGAFLKQRLSLAVQRGNAIAAMGTLPSEQDLG